MREKKWKYQEKKEYNNDLFLRLPDDKQSTVKISGWVITDKNVDGVTRKVFQADVIECDGKKMNHLLWIKNRDNLEFLKKKLKKESQNATLKLTKKYDEDNMDFYFEIEVVK